MAILYVPYPHHSVFLSAGCDTCLPARHPFITNRRSHVLLLHMLHHHDMLLHTEQQRRQQQQQQ
jgi:hypothetical protein